MEVKYFYLNNQIDIAEYIMINIFMEPQEFVEKYNLKEKVNSMYIFTRVTKVIYGLPQAGLIVHDSLVKHLEPYVYRPSSKTLVLWTHGSQSINFTLSVDDFGVKYLGKENALHLKASLEDKYKVTTDWEGKLYIGIALKWDYKKGTVQLKCQDMYIQHYINSNTKIKNTPVFNIILGKIHLHKNQSDAIREINSWRIG